MRRQTSGAVLGATLAAVVLGVMPACRGDRSDKPPRQFFPDMDDSPKFKPQTASEFFVDGRAMRPAVPGTVPFARWGAMTPAYVGDGVAAVWAAVLERDDLLREDDGLYRGLAAVSAEGRPVMLTRIPLPVTRDLLARGRERFDIYCAACHGYTGHGDGMVGRRWTGGQVPSFHDPKYRDPAEPDQKGTDGFLFRTAMWGVRDPVTGAQKMPAYAHALSVADAWAIVAYIRVLQAAQLGTLDDAPAEQRRRLEQERERLMNTSGTSVGESAEPAGDAGVAGIAMTGQRASGDRSP